MPERLPHAASAAESASAVRAISLAVVRRGDDLLVFRGEDDGAEFFRPLGGGIEFGETAEDALRREFAEELGAELTGLWRLGVLENRFVYAGAPGHEIVFVFAAELVPSDHALPSVVADTSEVVSWQPIGAFRRGETILYPVGLLDLVE